MCIFRLRLKQSTCRPNTNNHKSINWYIENAAKQKLNRWAINFINSSKSKSSTTYPNKFCFSSIFQWTNNRYECDHSICRKMKPCTGHLIYYNVIHKLHVTHWLTHCVCYYIIFHTHLSTARDTETEPNHTVQYSHTPMARGKIATNFTEKFKNRLT